MVMKGLKRTPGPSSTSSMVESDSQVYNTPSELEADCELITLNSVPECYFVCSMKTNHCVIKTKETDQLDCTASFYLHFPRAGSAQH